MPLRNLLGVRPGAKSRRLQRALSDFGIDEAFEAASCKMREHYGLEVTAGSIRSTCLALAKRLPVQEPVRRLPAQGAPCIITQVDGSMLPAVSMESAPAGADRRKHRKCFWNEVRTCTAVKQGSARQHYGYCRGSPEQVGHTWAQTTLDAGWGASSRIHVVGDGAAWIARTARVQFGPQGTFLLDLFHVLEYLAPASPTPETPASYIENCRSLLLQNKASDVIAELADRVEPPTTPDELAPVRCAHRYLSNRTDQLDYQSAANADLPVGSGMVESSHRFLLQKRLKLSGAWWLPQNADAIAALRTLRANGKWETLWTGSTSDN